MSNIRNMKIEKKFNYAIKVLEECLLKERQYLVIFQKPTEHKEWQTDNIDNCLYRISQLENGIEDLNMFQMVNLKKLLKK